jgi:DNA-binding response OmpR family regulator
MIKILVVEDDPKIAKLIVSDLELEGFKVERAADGLEGLEKAQRARPALIILDVMMPKMNGYDVCRALRREGVDVPIIMLTAKGQEADKVVGLGLGADDYVTKPFSGLELMARVKAHLRRSAKERDKIEEVAFDDLRINFKKMEAFKGKIELSLTPKEFQILEFLIRHKGDVVSRDKFLEEIWGYEDDMPTTRTVDNQVMTLRQKLAGKKGGSDDYIATVHGAGYKFVG